MNHELFHIQWHITERCNLRCIHCYREPWRQDLSFGKLKLIADRINSFVQWLGCNLSITLTGGEPFLKSEVYNLAEYLSTFEIVENINFITNGTVLPNEKLKKLYKLGKIYISVESDVEEINDKVRGKGSFEKMVTNLPYFVKNYNTGLMTTLLNTNIDYLINNITKFVSTFFNYGVEEIIFERFIPAGEARKVQQELVPTEKILMFYKKLVEITNTDFDQLKFYPAVKLVNKKQNNKLEIFGAECIVGKDGFAILCDGTIYPCRRFDTAIGNILTSVKFDIEALKRLDKLISKSKNEKLNYYQCFATFASIVDHTNNLNTKTTTL